MTFIIFLILLELEPFKGEALSKYEVWPAGYLTVNNGEVYFRVQRKRIVVFKIGGSQKARVITPDEGLEIRSFGVTKNEVHLSLFRMRTQSFTRLDRATGEVLGKSMNSYRFFAGEGRFRVSVADFQQKGYPKILTAAKGGKPFFKKPKEYLHFPHINSIWLASSKDQNYIVTPMTNKLYLHNEVIRRVEARFSRTSEGPASIRRLPLKKYKQPVQDYRHYTKGTDTDKLLRIKTRLAQQFIVFFGSVGKGWVVCYEIPDEVNGIAIGNHLGIQFFTDDFKPARFTESYGQVVGIDRDSVLILYPDGKQTNSLEEHYGLTGQESIQDLQKRQARYNQWQERELTISLGRENP